MPSSPSRIGAYTLYEIVGEGGMGTVYRASHPEIPGDVAFKLMSAELGADPEFKRRFHREAKLLYAMRHPNVPRFYEFGKIPDGRYFLAMEYVRGRRLADLAGESAAGLVAIFAQTARGLQAVHGQGIVHRDLSPENILIVEAAGRPVAKIIDFGISKSLDSDTSSDQLTRAGMFMGKLEYCSPEQLGALPGGETIDWRSDIYSLGIIFYRCLAGHSPFESAQAADLIAAQLHGKAPKLVALADGRVAPPRLSQLVARMLEKNREKRPRDMAEVASELEAVLPELASAVAVESGVSVAPGWAERWSRKFVGWREALVSPPRRESPQGEAAEPPGTKTPWLPARLPRPGSLPAPDLPSAAQRATVVARTLILRQRFTSARLALRRRPALAATLAAGVLVLVAGLLLIYALLAFGNER